MSHILSCPDLVRKWAVRSLQFTQLPGIHCGIPPPLPLPLHLPLFLPTSSSHSSAMLFNSGPTGCSPHIPPGCSADWTGRVESSYLPGGGEFCVIIGRRELNGSVGTPPTSLSTQKRRWQQLRSEERKKYTSSGRLKHTQGVETAGKATGRRMF